MSCFYNASACVYLGGNIQGVPVICDTGGLDKTVFPRDGGGGWGGQLETC